MSLENLNPKIVLTKHRHECSVGDRTTKMNKRNKNDSNNHKVFSGLQISC